MRVSKTGRRLVLAAAGILYFAAVPSVLAAVAALQAPSAAPVTFNKDIAPILNSHCVSCHRPGQTAPFSLLRYDDAVQRGTLIADATRRRYMPPWKPEPGIGDFQGVRRLRDEEISLIQAWVKQGRLRGNADDLKAPPQFPGGWTLGTPDIVVALRTPYTLRSEGADVFRTFVVPIPIEEHRYVRAIEFDPGSPKAVHHANLKIDATRSSRWLDEEEAGPGYEGSGARGARFPDGFFLGWTPGQSAQVVPDGSSWGLNGSSDLVIELHMTPTGRAEQIQPRVALYFTDQPPARLPFMIRLGRQDIDIPPGASRYVSRDRYVLPVDVDLLAIQPHAHWLARQIRGVAELPGGETKPLIYIADWDMRWQDVYRLRQPMRLPKGTRVTMEYTYDNSTANVKNPFTPPRRVTFGQTSSSEMGDLWLQVMAADESDRQRLDRDFAPKMLKEDITGIEKMLEIDGSDPRLHADLGLCYLEAGRTAQALDHLKTAARMQPTSPGPQHDVGVVLLKQRRFAEARSYFETAIQLKPDFAEAHSNFGATLHAEGRVDDAIASYTKALAIAPGNADVEYNLGRALISRGDIDAALAHYHRALAMNPDDPVTHASLGSALASRRQFDEAIVHYRRALELNPSLPAALVDLAWVFATSDRTDIRSPQEAIRLAERGVEVTERRSPTALDTLAVAYAAAGDFRRATTVAEEALLVATATGASELAEQIRNRLYVYRQRR